MSQCLCEKAATYRRSPKIGRPRTASPHQLPSQAWNSFRFVFNGAADSVEPTIVEISNRPAESFLVYADPQFIAFDLSESLKRNAALLQDCRRLLCVFRIDRNHDT